MYQTGFGRYRRFVIMTTVNFLAVKAYGELEFWFALVKILAIVLMIVRSILNDCIWNRQRRRCRLVSEACTGKRRAVPKRIQRNFAVVANGHVFII